MSDVAEKLGYYCYLAAHVSAKVRDRADFQEQYDAEYRAWMARKILIPPKDDEEKRNAYFAFCDEICRTNATTTGENLRIIFACNEAMEVLVDQDICTLSEAECEKAFSRAISYAENRRAQDQANDASTTKSTATFASSENLLEHLRDQFDPSFSQTIGSYERLLGQVIRYRNAAGNVEECTVLDYGTSRIKGKWFSITHNRDNSEEMIISASDMEDILLRRIQK